MMSPSVKRPSRCAHRRADGPVSHRINKLTHANKTGSFRRSFALPAHVTKDDISASYDPGVLTVQVSGAYAESHGQRIAIEAK